MRGFGILLLIFGAGSFILREMNMEFRLLKWVDNWGESNGIYIRVGIAALGLVLLLLSFRKKPSQQPDSQQQ
jgi:hypothetical protein